MTLDIMTDREFDAIVAEHIFPDCTLQKFSGDAGDPASLDGLKDEYYLWKYP